MGLVTRRSDQLDKLFENFVVDPKKAKKPQPKNKDSKDQKSDSKKD